MESWMGPGAFAARYAGRPPRGPPMLVSGRHRRSSAHRPHGRHSRPPEGELAPVGPASVRPLVRPGALAGAHRPLMTRPIVVLQGH
jgi:hypothetical protein